MFSDVFFSDVLFAMFAFFVGFELLQASSRLPHARAREAPLMGLRIGSTARF